MSKGTNYKCFRVWDSLHGKMLNADDIRMNLATGELHGKFSGGNVEHWVALQFSGFSDSEGSAIYEGDVVYIGGHGNTEIAFPFTDLVWAAMENDIGKILCNVYEHPERAHELLK